MTMIKVQTKRLGVELVSEKLARLDQARTSSRHTVHFRAVKAMEMNGMGMIAAIGEMNSDPVAFGDSEL